MKKYNVLERYRRWRRLKFLSTLRPLTLEGMATLTVGDLIYLKQINDRIDHIAISCGMPGLMPAGKIVEWKIIEVYSDGDVMLESTDKQKNRTLLIVASSLTFFESFNLLRIPGAFMRDQLILRAYRLK